jgi:putative ABC transport system permease protein
MQKRIGSKTKLIYAVLRPRWWKVWRELWHNKRRTALVVLSITLGVLTVSLTTGAQVILRRESPASYSATEPASITFTLSPFDDDLVKMVRCIPGVRNAEGRHSLSARLQTGPDTWSNLYLFAIPDFNDIRVNKVEPVNGAWPPLDHEVLIEQAAFSFTQARMGDLVEGSLIGLISWGLGYLLALPLSKWLSDAVGLATMQTPFFYTFSVEGALAWLVIVILLTNVACLFPARQACRLTIREVLAYE